MIKKTAIKILEYINIILIGLTTIIRRLLVIINSVKIYLKNTECSRYKDCLFLEKLKLHQPPSSDRYLEYPWMLKNVSMERGKLLDVGSSNCEMLHAFLPGIEVYAINITDVEVNYKNVFFIRGDIRKTDFSDNYFDYVTCISVLEHIGVYGRYGCDDDEFGDIKAMYEIYRVLKKNGILLLTVPYGIRDVLPINKLYNKKRIEKLLQGFEVIDRKFLKYNKKFNLWLEVTEQEASEVDMLKDGWYAIALIKACKI